MVHTMIPPRLEARLQGSVTDQPSAHLNSAWLLPMRMSSPKTLTHTADTMIRNQSRRSEAARHIERSFLPLREGPLASRPLNPAPPNTSPAREPSPLFILQHRRHHPVSPIRPPAWGAIPFAWNYHV